MAIDIRISYSRFDCLGRPFGAQGVLKAMMKYKIEKAILVPQMAVDSDFRLGNKELWDVIKGDPRLYGYLVPNPNYPKESIQLMRSAMASQKFVALALFRGATRPYPNVDDYREILNAQRRFGKPIFINAENGEAVEAVGQMAREFPTVKFIMGSMGGHDWKRAMTLSTLLNVSLETSGSFDAEKIEDAIENLSPARVLFGSNLPFSDPACMLALIQNSDIPKSTLERILSRNATRLYSLDIDEDVSVTETVEY
ncbi:MAG TPA: amidohydrolase family protein [Armatimonadota bacterium]|jgi:hypothetical protein